jgi:DNA-binding NarL/FixJ family response regulator
MSPIKLAIADDHKIFRKGLIATISNFDHIKPVIEADNGQELVDKVKLQQPDVILMDIQMPVLNGIRATEIIKELYPFIKILAISMYDDDNYIIRMLESGANGYLLKNAEPEEITRALDTVMKKQLLF